MNYKTPLFLILTCFLTTSCSSFKGWFGTDQTPSLTSKNGPKLGTSLADQELKRILSKQEKLITELESLNLKAEEQISADHQRKVEELVSHYKSLINNYPEYVYGYILYGKFLRQMGDIETANRVFVKANELDGNVAVIKQQIGNYLSENGQYELALPYFMSAIKLEPAIAIYHYQLGELLYQYHDLYLQDGKLERGILQEQMLKAFENAARLEPSNRSFKMRYAETFFDLDDPDWSAALAQWQALEKTATDAVEHDVIQLQKAHVLIEMNQWDEAEDILQRVDRASLEGNRQVLLDGLRQLRAGNY